MSKTGPYSKAHKDAFSKAINRRKDARNRAATQRTKKINKIANQWSSGRLSDENATKAREKVDWYVKDALAKADQAYDKAIKAAEVKSAKIKAETAKGWGRLDPKPTKKKTEKNKTGGVTGSRSFVQRNY